MAKLTGYPRRPAFGLLLCLYALPFEASRLKAMLFRRLGARVGRGVRFGRRAIVICRRFDETSIGDYTAFGDRALITTRALQTGEDVRFDTYVRVRGRGVLRVGDGCYVGAYAYIDANADVTIEDDAGVGPGSWIFTHSVWQSVLEGGPRTFAPVKVERGAWIPASVFIMPGVTIGRDAIVGARSLVTSDVPPGTFAAGSPAKVIRTAGERERDRPTPERQRELVASVLEEFARVALDLRVVDSVARGSHDGIAVYEFGKRRRPVAVVAFCPERLGPSHLARVNATTWIAFGGVEPETMPALGGRAWFDILSRTRSAHRDPFHQLLHEVFRGEFGIRFRIAT